MKGKRIVSLLLCLVLTLGLLPGITIPALAAVTAPADGVMGIKPLISKMNFYPSYVLVDKNGNEIAEDEQTKNLHTLTDDELKGAINSGVNYNTSIYAEVLDSTSSMYEHYKAKSSSNLTPTLEQKKPTASSWMIMNGIVQYDDGSYATAELTVRTPSGVELESVTVATGSSTTPSAANPLTIIDSPKYTLEKLTDAENTYKVTFHYTDDYAVRQVRVRLNMKKTQLTTYDVNFHYAGQTITKKFVEGDTGVTAPTDDDLSKTSAGTAYYTKVDGWYEKEDLSGNPVDLSTFQPTANADLYAKTSAKEGVTVPIILEVRTYDPISESTDNTVSNQRFTYYVPTATGKLSEIIYNTQYPDFTSVTLQVPLGEKLGDTIVTGDMKTLFEGTTFPLPSRGGKITGWHYSETGTTYDRQSVTKDTVIPLDLAIAKYDAKKPLQISAELDMYFTVKFNSNLEGVSAPDDFNFTAHTSGGPFAPEWETEAKKWVAEQEKTGDRLFRGWYLDAACSDNMKYTGSADLDVTLYAKWVTPCKVKFDMNGVNVSNAASFPELTVGTGDLLTQPAATPTAVTTEENAVAFAGWYKDADCKNAWDFSKDIVEKDTTLYAKWDAARWVEVTFRTYHPDDITKEHPTDTTVKVPVAAGYQFGPLPQFPSDEGTKNVVVGEKRTFTYQSWQYEIGGFTETLTSSTVLNDKLGAGISRLIVTAQATPSFTFTFDTNGGSAIPAQTYTGGSHTATKPTDPTKESCEFAGWFKNKDCTQSFSFEEAYEINTTIYAKWKEPTRYELVFDCSSFETLPAIELKNGEDVVAPQKTEAKKVTYSLLAGTYQFTISAPGYKTLRQTAWTIDEKTKLTYNYEVKLEAFVPVTDITMSSTDVMQGGTYALNDRASVTPDSASSKSSITWSAAEGTTLPEGVTLDGASLTVAKNVAVKTEISLTASVAGGILGSDNTTEQPYTKTIRLTVTKYLPLITFANGTSAHPNTVTLPEATRVNDNLTLTAPTEPTCAGWIFKGWYKDDACTEGQQWVFSGAGADKAEDDLTLYAKWEQEAQNVTVTYTGDGGTANANAQTSVSGKKSGDEITLLPNMFTKDGYLFRAWKINNGQTMFANNPITLAADTEMKAVWTQISESIKAEDLEYALRGVTKENAKDYKPQLLAARDALAAGTETKTNETWIQNLDGLFTEASLATVTLSGDASTGVSQKGAILSAAAANGTVKIELSKVAAPSYTLPEAYQNSEYQAAWRKGALSVDGTTKFSPIVPVTITMPIPSELEKMAADTIRILVFKDSTSEPAILTPKLVENKLQFTLNAFGQMAFVGKEISDAKDTRVTALVMKYKDKAMGHVTQDANGNFTVTLPATTNESTLQDLLLGTDWVTYLTVAPQASVTPEGAAAQTAETWAKTGVRLEYDLKSANNYSKTRKFTVTAGDGTTTRTFTVTVKKITDADRTYKIAVSNINGGTVTASPSPAAAGEEVKLTVTPNDGKKLVAGSLSYCLQSPGAKSVPIDESSLAFIMPAGDININAQFEDDASAPLKNPPQITAFVVNGVSAVINSDTKAITIILPYGTDLKHVAPTIVTANASKVEPSSAQRVDLSTPKAYRVYASNGAYVTYTVTAYTEEPSPTQSLWEKLQNQINSNPNWWELAEYQKKTGYYK